MPAWVRLPSLLAPWLLAGAFVCVAPLASAEPSEADKAQARDLTQGGLDALAKKDFEAAFSAFSRADKLFRAPTISLGLARSAAATRRLVLAQETYQKLSREPVSPGSPEAFVQAVEAAKRELAELLPRVPALTINVSGAKEFKITLDGEPLSAAAVGARRPVDPGKHRVRAEAEGCAPAEAEVAVAEGQKDAHVELTLAPGARGAAAPTPTSTAPAPTPAPSPPASPADGGKRVHPGAWAGLALGGVGLVLGAVFGVKAMSRKKDLDARCVAGHCPPDATSEHDAFTSAATVSTVGFAIGAVGLGAGTYFLIGGSTKTPSSASLGLGGSF